MNEEMLDLANDPALEHILNENEEAFDLEYQDWLDQFHDFVGALQIEKGYGANDSCLGLTSIRALASEFREELDRWSAWILGEAVEHAAEIVAGCATAELANEVPISP